nr:RNA-directed DNA polymerase, eukaryota [Tanacetum cinerariifolium]
VWRFISQDNSLWARVVSAIHGPTFQVLAVSFPSLWNSFVREIYVLKSRGIDLVSYCKKRVGNDLRTRFWEEVWIGDQNLSNLFPRIFVLENDKSCTVAAKLQDGLERSLRRQVSLNRLPTRLNLVHRGVQVSSLDCPICSLVHESSSHILFSCYMATDIARLICRWWDLGWSPFGSYVEWFSWFKNVKLGSILKDILEGVFYVAWWNIWIFRNQLLFASRKPRNNVLFDDIVARSFMWCNARCKVSFSWDYWLQYPSLIPM